MFTAASMSFAFKSFILITATSSNCARVILPTLSVCGTPLPFLMPVTFKINNAAGGVLVINVKLRSL